MSRVSEGIIPPGGWHYRDPGGYRVPATGEAYGLADLVDRVFHYRLENKVPVGDPSADVEKFICETFPAMCGMHSTPRGHFVVNSVSQERQVDVVNAWVNTLLTYHDKGQIERVPESEAQARSQACRDCPFNVVYENECGSCVTTAQRGLAIIRSGQDVHGWQKLHFCKHHRFEARTAIWLNRHTFGPANSPGNCWLK